jgi:hypothetical protein
VFDRVETLLLLRLKLLRIEPNNERLGFSGAGVTVWDSWSVLLIEELRNSHTRFPVGMIGDVTCSVCFKGVGCVIDIKKVLSLTQGI